MTVSRAVTVVKNIYRIGFLSVALLTLWPLLWYLESQFPGSSRCWESILTSVIGDDVGFAPGIVVVVIGLYVLLAAISLTTFVLFFKTLGECRALRPRRELALRVHEYFDGLPAAMRPLLLLLFGPVCGLLAQYCFPSWRGADRILVVFCAPLGLFAASAYGAQVGRKTESPRLWRLLVLVSLLPFLTMGIFPFVGVPLAAAFLLARPRWPWPIRGALAYALLVGVLITLHRIARGQDDHPESALLRGATWVVVALALTIALYVAFRASHLGKPDRGEASASAGERRDVSSNLHERSEYR